jgi:hypothetical protein
MRLELCLLPDPLHSRFADAERCRHLPAGPVSAAICRRFRCFSDHPRLQSRRHGFRLAALVLRIQPCNPITFEAAFPARDCRTCCAQFSFDAIPTLTVRQRQDQSGTKYIARRQASGLCPPCEFASLFITEQEHRLIASHTPRAPNHSRWLHSRRDSLLELPGWSCRS